MMNSQHRMSVDLSITDMIFETFRLHGQLIAFGDHMVREYGLTSARWQVLGSIALSEVEITIPNIARNLGLSRQAVQRVANDLVDQGLVFYLNNPHHKRAKLALLTDKGRHIYMKADRKYSDWANNAARELNATRLDAVLDAMATLRGFCDTYLEEPEKGIDK